MAIKAIAGIGQITLARLRVCMSIVDLMNAKYN